jgi:uncharacterized protein (DUF2252 family)
MTTTGPTAPPASPLTGSAAGRAARGAVPRSAHGPVPRTADRPDPIAILEQQARTRVPELVPIRYGRMAASRFAFLRGAPAVMAADLASTPNTGLTVQLCGDAHLSNFGFFASPERALLFDLNDFDETLPGPFEWDVKRLAASVAVAARDNGDPDQAALEAARAAVRSYRKRIRSLARQGDLEVWYERLDTADLLPAVRKANRAEARAELAKARGRTSLQALEKLTETNDDGERRIRHDPPLLEPIDPRDLSLVHEVHQDILHSLADDRRALLSRYRLVDAAVKVVGVGSVGTRCFVVLLEGRTTGDPLFLQVKEAEESVLSAHLGPSAYRHQGRRVVAGQQLTQAASDIFLGWATGPAGRFFYVRQLRDMKGSVEVGRLTAPMLARYAAVCGEALARAHARSGDRAAIAAYLGRGDTFDGAVAEWALSCADRTDADHAALLAAIDAGRITARHDT